MRMYVRKLPAMMLAGCAGLALTGAVLAANTPETEPNDNKGSANAVTLACGDSVSGITTGSSTTVAGDASSDNFLITTPTATPGIYKYTLTLNSPTAGHTGTIRGLNQTTGVPGTTDSTVQTSTTVGTDRLNVFYGFGTGGQIYYRVTGGAATTGQYTSTLTCQPVTPITIPGFVQPGSITIKPDAATDTAIDTDWWLYDSNFNAIADGGHDDGDATGITRTLAAGDYYIALSNYNSCNNLGSPADDTFRTGIVTDFPNVWVCSTTGALATMNMTVSDGANTLTGIGSRANSFETAWFKFTVVVPSFPTATGAQNPNPVVRTNPVQLTLTITPAPGSSLDNITSVTGNVSAVSGNAGDTAVVFTRTGPGSSDWAYNVPAANGVIGTQQVSYTIVDPMASGGNGNGAFNVVISAPPAANDTCATATLINTIPFTDGVVANTATNDLDVSCNATTNTEARYGIWYRYHTGPDGGTLVVSETGTNDVTIAAFSGDCNNLTQIFCADAEANQNILLPQPNTDYWILISMWSQTTIPAGNYGISVTAFNAVSGGCCTGGNCTITTASACAGTFLGAATTCDAAPQYRDVPGSPVAIPDYPAGGISSVITVPATDTTMITDLQVRVGVTHTFGSDIGLQLVTPSNVTIDLLKRVGTATCALGETGDGSGLAGLYTFSDSAAQSLAAAMIASTAAIPAGTFKASTCPTADVSINAVVGGQPLAGTWTLLVADQDEIVTGTFSSFELIVNGGYSPCPGACCTTGVCSFVSRGTCLSGGGSFTAGVTCTPDPCGAVQSGACCRGSTCAIDTAANCTGFAQGYAGNNTVCNAFGVNNVSPCCLADYNHLGGIGVQDIFDFLAGYFGGDSKADINGGGVGVQDIFDFLAVYFSGGC